MHYGTLITHQVFAKYNAIGMICTHLRIHIYIATLSTLTTTVATTSPDLLNHLAVELSYRIPLVSLVMHFTSLKVSDDPVCMLHAMMHVRAIDRSSLDS